MPSACSLRMRSASVSLATLLKVESSTNPILPGSICEVTGGMVISARVILIAMSSVGRSTSAGSMPRCQT